MSVSNELIVCPFNRGVILSKPTLKTTDDIALNYSTVGNLLNLPMNVFFMDYNSIILSINETTAKTCGFSSLQDAIGGKISRAAQKESAKFSLQHDETVMAINSIKVAEESFIRRIDNRIMQFISFKMPWYDKEKKMLGIFGFTISLEDHDLAACLLLMAKTKLITMSHVEDSYGKIIDDTFVSKQELKCLKLLAEGCTAKQIAHCLDISSRTVEHYLENLRIKLNVASKQEMIAKLIHMKII